MCQLHLTLLCMLIEEACAQSNRHVYELEYTIGQGINEPNEFIGVEPYKRILFYTT